MTFPSFYRSSLLLRLCTLIRGKATRINRTHVQTTLSSSKMEELGSKECYKIFISLEMYKTIGFSLVSPAVSYISGPRKGERSAHGTDVFPYLHPHRICSLQQSRKEKCSVVLMNAKLWINNFLVNLTKGITCRHCAGKFSNIDIALCNISVLFMIADAHVYTNGDFILQVFLHAFNIMNLVTAQCFKKKF